MELETGKVMTGVNEATTNVVSNGEVKKEEDTCMAKREFIEGNGRYVEENGEITLVEVMVENGEFEIPEFVDKILRYGASPFMNCVNLKLKNKSKITDLDEAFCGSKIESLDLSEFDSSRIKSMYETFDSCYNLKKIDLRNFNTSKVRCMEMMFFDCKSLEEIDISSFDTEKVINMPGMFGECEKLKKIKLPDKMNLSNTLDIHGMFSGCKELRDLDISDWDLSSVIDYSYLINNCSYWKEFKLPMFMDKKIAIIGIRGLRNIWVGLEGLIEEKYKESENN